MIDGRLISSFTMLLKGVTPKHKRKLQKLIYAIYSEYSTPIYKAKAEDETPFSKIYMYMYTAHMPKIQQKHYPSVTLEKRCPRSLHTICL
jgi:hypothetical protein